MELALLLHILQLMPNMYNPLLEVNGNYVALMPFGFIRELENPNVQYNSRDNGLEKPKKDWHITPRSLKRQK